jgi:hypothetical protein
MSQPPAAQPASAIIYTEPQLLALVCCRRHAVCQLTAGLPQSFVWLTEVICRKLLTWLLIADFTALLARYAGVHASVPSTRNCPQPAQMAQKLGTRLLLHAGGCLLRIHCSVLRE